MAQLLLFDSDDELPPQAARLGPRLRALAEEGIFLGTSSWKYPGWLGSIYARETYVGRGKFQESRFEAECLAEYARTFSLVGGDFSFYTFPSMQAWRRFFDQTPDTFRAALKVPEEITVPVWPGHARYGARAGLANAHFLDVDLLTALFTRPLESFRERVAVLMFEFGAYARSTFASPAAFLDRLEPFLQALPPGFRYGVEVRNPELLESDYLERLARHNVAHVFNAWTRMPELSDQIALPGAFTADFTVARALLRKGRAYERAVQLFEPYEATREPDPSGRVALRTMVVDGRIRRRPTFLLVNNRYEGNAPSTIEAVIDGLEP
jgi:uncharacterized protein YecE (DUF72 family)